jgi:phosphohistidine phosphatase
MLQVSQLGGGRIDHNAKERKLHVYSSSQGFGLANHSVTCAILRQWYPLHSITLAWGG